MMRSNSQILNTLALSLFTLGLQTATSAYFSTAFAEAPASEHLTLDLSTSTTDLQTIVQSSTAFETEMSRRLDAELKGKLPAPSIKDKDPRRTAEITMTAAAKVFTNITNQINTKQITAEDGKRQIQSLKTKLGSYGTAAFDFYALKLSRSYRESAQIALKYHAETDPDKQTTLGNEFLASAKKVGPSLATYSIMGKALYSPAGGKELAAIYQAADKSHSAIMKASTAMILKSFGAAAGRKDSAATRPSTQPNSPPAGGVDISMSPEVQRSAEAQHPAAAPAQNSGSGTGATAATDEQKAYLDLMHSGN